MGFFSGRKVVVTGANGFIGSNLVKRLLSSHAEVVCITRPGADLWRLADIKQDITLVPHDLQYKMSDLTRSSVRIADFIYHLGASGVNQSFTDNTSMISANVGGTVEMLTAALDWGVSRFIYCGSCFEYGSGTWLSEDHLPHPMNQYAASKSAAWMHLNAFARQYDLDVVSLRPFTVYGPFEGGFRLVAQTISRALEGTPIQLTKGEQSRDFVYVDDLVDAFLLAASAPGVSGETINVCTGVATSVRSIVETILRITGTASEPEFGALPYRDVELWELSGNPDKARRLLKWEPVRSLDDGIEQTVNWLSGASADIQHYYSGRQ
jgi:nucleoside-diphosphate-sugar epimerase